MKHRKSYFKARFARTSLIAIVTGCFLWGSLSQAQSDEPVRHTIVKGDTLWNLSTRYLESPWLWPELWEQNTYIKNPDLIFPNDVLIISPNSIRLIRNKQLTTNKLSPQIRATPSHAITTIDPSVIMPFLTQSVIIEPEVLENSAYVLQGVDGKIVLGKYSRFYATGLEPSFATEYLIFSKGRIISDKVTDTAYGTEAVHLGTARMIRQEGDIAEMEVIRANQDIHPGEYLIPIDEPSELPRYFPRRPGKGIDTRILSIPKGVHEAGRRDVVIISGGKQDGLEEGHVLEVFSFRGQIRDPKTDKQITLPDDQIAILMIFKAYEKVSYALLMETSAAVKVGDRASSP
jgi:hypothetical protein